MSKHEDNKELSNIISALIFLRFKEEVNAICANIDVIEKQLSSSCLEYGISKTNDEFLDIILDCVPVLYKMKQEAS